MPTPAPRPHVATCPSRTHPSGLIRCTRCWWDYTTISCAYATRRPAAGPGAQRTETQPQPPRLHRVPRRQERCARPAGARSGAATGCARLPTHEKCVGSDIWAHSASSTGGSERTAFPPSSTRARYSERTASPPPPRAHGRRGPLVAVVCHPRPPRRSCGASVRASRAHKGDLRYG